MAWYLSTLLTLDRHASLLTLREAQSSFLLIVITRSDRQQGITTERLTFQEGGNWVRCFILAGRWTSDHLDKSHPPTKPEAVSSLAFHQSSPV